VINATY